MMMENELRRKLGQQVADFYESQGQAFSSKRTSSWNVFSLLSDRLKPGDLLVDVGAGNGRLAEVLPPGVRYLGVEPSSSLRQEASKAGHEVVAGSLPKLDLPDESADAIACIAVFHHIPSVDGRRQAIAELHRILKPGGTLLLTVWNLRARRFWSWSTVKYAWLRLSGISGSEPGDMYYTWKASGLPQERYVHAFTLREFKTLFDPKDWRVEKIGAYDKQGWCSWWQGRNLVVLAKKK